MWPTINLLKLITIFSFIVVFSGCALLGLEEEEETTISSNSSSSSTSNDNDGAGNSQNYTDKLRILGIAENYSGERGTLLADPYAVSDLDATKVYTFQWFSDGNAISGATEQTLYIGDYLSWVENKDITVQLTYTNTSRQQQIIESGKMPYGSFRISVGGETGSVNSGLAVPLIQSYSNSTTGSDVVDANGVNYVANNIHAIATEHAPEWAREGNYVISFYADGTGWPDTSTGYAGRAELSDNPSEYAFKPGEERYYSMSFLPPSKIWDDETLYSIVITQWKQFGVGTPNFEIRLSNKGDYKLLIRSKVEDDGVNDRVDLQEIATVDPDQWNDIKYYIKHSAGNDGVLKIWLDGVEIYNYSGPTLNPDQPDKGGYIKFGLYADIQDERIIYWDAIDISDHLTTNLETWLRSFDNLPVKKSYKLD
jgi:hypothetical protein